MLVSPITEVLLVKCRGDRAELVEERQVDLLRIEPQRQHADLEDASRWW
jgi:hypothetical protein